MKVAPAKTVTAPASANDVGIEVSRAPVHFNVREYQPELVNGQLTLNVPVILGRMFADEFVKQMSTVYGDSVADRILDDAARRCMNLQVLERLRDSMD